MGLMKVFSGSEVLALALQGKIEAAGVDTVIKNNVQSAKLAGFGTTGQAVELFMKPPASEAQLKSWVAKGIGIKTSTRLYSWVFSDIEKK